jgi:hypothetical protein
MFFEPSIDCVVDAVLNQRRMALKSIFVEHFLAFSASVFNFDSSMSYSLAGSLPATGYSTRSARI